MVMQGYTLPVFAVAAAKAALVHLINPGTPVPSVDLDLLSTDSQQPARAEIPVEQVALIDERTALAITRSVPGDNLDLTRHTPLWAWVQRQDPELNKPRWVLEAGAGVGRTSTGEPAIYSYAQRLCAATLDPLLPEGWAVVVRIILPEGRRLWERTSNAAFGIMEGLALLGTSGLSLPESTLGYLEQARADLRRKAEGTSALTLCIGSHGQQVAVHLGIPPEQVVLTSNWLGALLVEAGLCGVKTLKLIGYHGKLIKLAGGIFNTSSHVADGRLEILAAAVLRGGAPASVALGVLEAPTVENACMSLQAEGWGESLFPQLATQIAARAQAYVYKYAAVSLGITVILFDRRGHILT